MYTELVNSVDTQIAQNATLVVPLTGDFQLSVVVNEDEMLVRCEFSGVVLGNGGATFAEAGFEIDGVAPAQALTATKLDDAELWPLSCSRTFRLSRGTHTIAAVLRTDDTVVNLRGSLYPSRLEVTVLSNNNVLAANDNAKRQGIY